MYLIKIFLNILTFGFYIQRHGIFLLVYHLKTRIPLIWKVDHYQSWVINSLNSNNLYQINYCFPKYPWVRMIERNSVQLPQAMVIQQTISQVCQVAFELEFTTEPPAVQSTNIQLSILCVIYLHWQLKFKIYNIVNDVDIFLLVKAF